MMKTYDYYIKKVGEVGYVESVMQSMVYATGLPHARVLELVVTESGQRGIVQSLQRDYVEILMLDGRPVRHGTALVRTNEILEIPVGEELLGRSVDPFINPIDGKEPFTHLETMQQFEAPAPPIANRVVITEPFLTGVAIVDLMVPLGRGQRELVIGDPKTGKTAFLLQTIAAQAQMDTVCIYVAVGQKKTSIKRTQEYFQASPFHQNVILVAADASSPASFIYLVPFTGMAIAEYFRNRGRQVLLVFDNLNIHAKLYREIALLSKKTPGREAYPGDIFYLHSHLVERAGNIRLPDGKTAAITLLATVETVGGDFTGYIQTNSMSMTDGHIYFDANIFQEGRRPAINVAQSVSRVGHQTQSKLARSFSDHIREILTDYRHAQNYARFGVELTEKTRLALDIGEKAMQVFHQDQVTIIPQALQYLYFGLLMSGFWDGKQSQVIRGDKEALAQAYIKETLTPLLTALKTSQTVEEYIGKLSPNIAKIIVPITPSGLPPAKPAPVAQPAPQAPSQAALTLPGTAQPTVGQPVERRHRSFVGKLFHRGGS